MGVGASTDVHESQKFCEPNVSEKWSGAFGTQIEKVIHKVNLPMILPAPAVLRKKSFIKALSEAEILGVMAQENHKSFHKAESKSLARKLLEATDSRLTGGEGIGITLCKCRIGFTLQGSEWNASKIMVNLWARYGISAKPSILEHVVPRVQEPASVLEGFARAGVSL